MELFPFVHLAMDLVLDFISYVSYHITGIVSLVGSTTTEEPMTCATAHCPPTSTCKEEHGYVYCDCPEGKTGMLSDTAGA